MKRYIHLSFCCLMVSMVQAHAPATVQCDASDMQAQARDAKTSHILSCVGRVVESLIKVIKDPHNKPAVLLNVGEMLSGVFDIAANSLPHHELTAQEAEEFRQILRDTQAMLEPMLRQYLCEQLRDVKNILQAIALDELDRAVRRSDMNFVSDEIAVIPAGNEHQQELHSNVLNALHGMVHDLFAIMQNPENPQVVGQSIADMLANIMNVASQTLKYEYLSSSDAEENVATYLESFSHELTKEIKHLMLQTALHLRGGCCGCASKPCCNTCTTNSCSSCCKSSCSSAVCKPCCKPCNSCNRTVEIQDDAERKCCSSCGSSSGNCGCGCKSEAITQDDAERKCCSSCGSSSGNCGCGCKSEAISQDDAERKCCSSCGSSTGNCGCGCKSEAISQDEAANKCGCNKPKPNQDAVERSGSCCNSCGKASCGSCGSSTGNCGCGCKSEAISEDEAANKCGCNKPKPKQDAMVERSGSCCNSCGKASCGSCGKATCGCGCKSEAISQDEASNKCGCNKPKPKQDAVERKCCSSCGSSTGNCGCGCKSQPLTQDAYAQVSKLPKPGGKTIHASKAKVERSGSCCNSCGKQSCGSCGKATCGCGCKSGSMQGAAANRCGCNKPKPKPQQNLQDEQNRNKGCCGSSSVTATQPKINNRAHKKLSANVQYAESYASGDAARMIAEDQAARKRAS